VEVRHKSSHHPTSLGLEKVEDLRQDGDGGSRRKVFSLPTKQAAISFAQLFGYAKIRRGRAMMID
jgi:hypothetical protein